MNDHRISRRSFLAAAGMAGAAAALTACGGAASSAASSVASSAAASSEAAQSVELIVFAAASLTETLNAIGESYTAEHPEVTFRFNFDSSGTLKTQIQEGADCDLFISAGQKQMNQLDITASADVNKDGLDFVDADSRVNLLENKVVLCVPEGSDKGIDSFDALAEHLKAQDILFCMGNSDVPVGQLSLIHIFSQRAGDRAAMLHPQGRAFKGGGGNPTAFPQKKRCNLKKRTPPIFTGAFWLCAAAARAAHSQRLPPA